MCRPPSSRIAQKWSGGKVETKNPSNVPKHQPHCTDKDLTAAKGRCHQTAVQWSAIPALRPSILSRKLNTLIINIQKTDRTVVTILFSMNISTRTSAQTAATAAAANCTANLKTAPDAFVVPQTQ